MYAPIKICPNLDLYYIKNTSSNEKKKGREKKKGQKKG